MFKRNTVFILGAGASWHYGYPTGEDLVQRVSDAALLFSTYFKEAGDGKAYPQPGIVYSGPPGQKTTQVDIRNRWRTAHRQCGELARRIHFVNPLVIDYFLRQNRDLEQIGRFLISWVLLSCEEEYFNQRGNPNRRELLRRSPNPEDQVRAKGLDVSACKDRWCRFILHKLLNGCTKPEDLDGSNVHFITFNYDMSLERELYAGLSPTNVIGREAAAEFLGNGRIIHCYGQIRAEREPTGEVRSDRFRNFFTKEFRHELKLEILDEVLEASKPLKTIDPEDKISSIESMKEARRRIAEAEVIYILGYGFDENNSDRLGLKELSIRSPRPTIMFTNFRDSNRINKKAGRASLSDPSAFLPPAKPLQRYPGYTSYIEKSQKDVYEALELDFDELEDR